MRISDAYHALRQRVSMPWFVLMLVCIACIWGNSLVPGEGSGSFSLAVTQWLQGCLASVGLPFEWLTNFIVRKTAHFTEYLLLGVVASQAFDPKHLVSRQTIFATALLCATVPTIDETIQLFVAERSGQVADVLLDCCGALTGIVARSQVALRIRAR